MNNENIFSYEVSFLTRLKFYEVSISTKWRGGVGVGVGH